MDYVRVASKSSPIYSIHFLNSDKLDVFVDAVTTDLKLTENKNELAQKVTINLVNCMNGEYLLSELINVCDTCYDNLIYLQNSEDSYYYPAGWKTVDIFNDICSKWGIEIVYNYESIEHKKLPLSGKISTMFTDLLDRVKKKTGIKYVIRSAEDIIYIDRYGANANERVYEINRGENAISTASNISMEDVVTKIIFTGKADDDGKVSITGTLEGDTAKWGTLQKVIRDDTEDEKSNKKSDKEKEDSLYENARDEGQYILDEKGKPKETYEVTAINNPWIRKGELVKVGAGDMNFRYIVTSITHNAVNRQMNIDFELADESKL